MEYRNVGIDLGIISRHTARVRDDEGKALKGKFTFCLCKEEFDRLVEKSIEGAKEGTKLRFVFEATGMSWLPVTIYAKKNGIAPVRIKTQKAYALRQYFGKYRKNDHLDANTLSFIPVFDKDALEEVFLPDAKTYALERYCRQRYKISKQIGVIKSRIRSFYHWLMPGLVECFNEPFGETALRFYKNFTNPIKAKEAGTEDIKKVLFSGGKKIDEKLVEQIYHVVLNAYQLYEGGEEWIDFEQLQEEINIEIEMLEYLVGVEKRVEKKIEEIYKLHSLRGYLESIKGLGNQLAPSILAKIGNPDKFSSQKKFRSFVGIIPRQDDSGETNKKGLPIT